MAKPFLKWAGGKGQLLNIIEENLPLTFNTYIEPFVGSGAVMFDVLRKIPTIQRVIINDINSDLINTYVTIRDHCEELLKILGKLQDDYYSKSPLDKGAMFYTIRDEYNQRDTTKLRMAALFIFLNRTCFNGLYRVNSKNLFNVPFGKYVNPKICDKTNLLEVSSLLKKVELFNGDYSDLAQFADKDCFVYLDPPYKPISETSTFNSYCACNFDDTEQVRLKEFCDLISKRGAKFMLSNSDPSSINPENDFFDRLYSAYSIRRVMAKRNINSKADKRGAINELLITNY